MLLMSALLIPSMVFLWWSAMMLCLKDKDRSQKKLTATLLTAAACCFADAVTMHSLIGFRNAAIIDAAGSSGAFLPGFKAPVYGTRRNLCQKACDAILTAEVIISFSILSIKAAPNPFRGKSVIRFLKGNGRVPSSTAECMIAAGIFVLCSARAIIGSDFLSGSPGITALFSVLLGGMGFFFAYIGAWFPDREFDLWDFGHPAANSAFIPSAGSAAPVQDSPKHGARFNASSGDSSVRTIKTTGAARLEQFMAYMAAGKPYLNPGLSIADVAMALSSNRTYISVLVNETFEMSFRDYINRLRIEYSKQAMLNNPDEILEVTAERCGFGSDSQFVRKFKDIEGISPKQWLAQQLSQK